MCTSAYTAWRVSSFAALVRQRRPHRPRYLAVLEMRLPEGEQFVSGLHALEAGDVAGVFLLEVLVQVLRDGIAVAGAADGLDVQQVFVAQVAGEGMAAGEARQFVHGQAGADQRAVELVLEVPQPRAAGRLRRLARRVGAGKRLRPTGLGERPGDRALALEGWRHARHPCASCSAASAKRENGHAADRALAFEDVDQLARVLAQVRVGVRVRGDALEQQRRQLRGARAAGGHVAFAARAAIGARRQPQRRHVPGAQGEGGAPEQAGEPPAAGRRRAGQAVAGAQNGGGGDQHGARSAPTALVERAAAVHAAGDAQHDVDGQPHGADGQQVAAGADEAAARRHQQLRQVHQGVARGHEPIHAVEHQRPAAQAGRGRRASR
jgi:hypothetical protein